MTPHRKRSDLTVVLEPVLKAENKALLHVVSDFGGENGALSEIICLRATAAARERIIRLPMVPKLSRCIRRWHILISFQAGVFVPSLSNLTVIVSSERSRPAKSFCGTQNFM